MVWQVEPMDSSACAGNVYPYSKAQIGTTELMPRYRVELRNPDAASLDRFFDANQVSDWSQVGWKDVGKPYQVKEDAKGKTEWETKHQEKMSVQSSWEYFNRSFHEWFVKDVPQELADAKRNLRAYLARFRWSEVKAVLGHYLQLSLWNYVQRVEDGIWDPRGKRALFQGLDVHKPRILFLGAVEGYEAMQLFAMYPGGEAVLVDYDAF